ncbi:AMP-binding protein [Croceitalea sp. MTPC5]|uniref:AMP-binding protein n=1 Tax=Croceitalea sp. MTPC5 TaxID=3056565 RepID=UPI002B3756A9|nr:AMP-binding protein [Croceitalea sp. MTPC5]
MKIHPKFKLNGRYFNAKSLAGLSYSLTKEGAPFEIAIGHFLLEWLNPSPEITVKTSGSTGRPKQIPLQKAHMVNSALATGAFFNLKPGNSSLLCLSADFIAGKMMLVRALVLGLELDYVAPSATPLLANSTTYDFCAMVPMQVQNSLEVLYKVKQLIIGGAPVNNSLRKKLRLINTACYETYGMTETITHVAVKPLGDSSGVFKTLPDITVSIDERDCLVINAPKITNKKVVTNDIVKLINEEKFQWLGRFDTIINSGGVKLIPEQIEAKLARLFPGRIFVIGIPDGKLGQKAVLFYESESELSNIQEQVAKLDGLAKYEIPKAFYPVAHFAETKSGKVDRLKTSGQVN